MLPKPLGEFRDGEAALRPPSGCPGADGVLADVCGTFSSLTFVRQRRGLLEFCAESVFKFILGFLEQAWRFCALLCTPLSSLSYNTRAYLFSTSRHLPLHPPSCLISTPRHRRNKLLRDQQCPN